MKTSCGPIAAFDSFTFRAVAALVTWLMIFTRLVSFSLPAGGVPMLTAMRTSAPALRAVITGKFSATPPSTSSRPSISIGAKRPGNAMLARMASATFPRDRTIPSPLATSVAVARKGIGSLSKSSTERRGEGELAEDEVELLPLDEAGGERRLPVLDADGELREERGLVELAPERLVVARHLVLEGAVPVHRGEGVLHLLRRHAGRVEAADDRAHAGPGDEVDGDVDLLQDLQDADVRGAARAAAGEDEPETGPGGGPLRLLLSANGKGNQGDEKGKTKVFHPHAPYTSSVRSGQASLALDRRGKTS